MIQTPRINERSDVEEQPLRPLKGEYRNDEIAVLASQRRLDFAEQRAPLLDGQILADSIAIGALANHMIKP